MTLEHSTNRLRKPHVGRVFAGTRGRCVHRQCASRHACHNMAPAGSATPLPEFRSAQAGQDSCRASVYSVLPTESSHPPSKVLMGIGLHLSNADQFLVHKFADTETRQLAAIAGVLH